MEVRAVRPEEREAAGQLVVAAYRALPGQNLSGDYAELLADVARRDADPADAEVLVTVTGGDLIGCVTFVPRSDSPWAEHVQPGESSIRMLAVRPDAQSRGAGRALVDECIHRARALGNPAVFLHSTPWMPAAHRLYERMGFERVPERDWTPVPEIPLLAYRLPLGPDGSVQSGESAE